MFHYISSIIASIQSKKIIPVSVKSKTGEFHPIYNCTKEQSQKWLDEGKCQCCGGDCGEHKGICDNCLNT